MKVAYCIQTHFFSPLIEAFVDILAEGNDFYLHVDRKTEIERYASLDGRVDFIGDRCSVCWGGFSQIESSLGLLAATRRSDCDYIIFCSGDTLPLHTNDRIKGFLAGLNNADCLFFRPVRKSHYKRLKYIHDQSDARNGGLKAKVNALSNRLPLLRKENPYYGLLPRLAFGANWIVITPRFRDYVFDYLRQNPFYLEAFRYSKCGDEHFFHTIMNDSPYMAVNRCLRTFYVDWDTGPQCPRLLDESDLGRILAERDGDGSSYMFARKFTPTLDIGKFRAVMDL